MLTASASVVAVPYLGAVSPACSSTRANAPRSSARWVGSGEGATTGTPAGSGGPGRPDRARRELGGAGVHRVEHRPHAEAPADLPDDGLGGAAQLGELRVGKAVLLGHGQRPGVQRLGLAYLLGDLVDVLDLLDEPGVDAGRGGDVMLAGAGSQRLVDGGQPAVVRGPAVTEQALGVARRAPEAERAVGTLHRPQGLLQSLGEAPADGHRL